jgi:hypothetical protein
MSKRYFILFILALLSFSNLYSVTKINPYLAEVISRSNDADQIPIYITFNNSLTLLDFADISYDTPKKVRRQIVINRLIEHSNQTQSTVRNFISSHSPQAQLVEYLWMVNIIVLKANQSFIYDLDAAGFSEISQINYDPQYPIEQMLDLIDIASPFMIPPPEPGVTLMNADDCWALGNKGRGTLVANADDGFWWRHPDLVRGVWQNLGEDANSNGMTIIWAAGTGSSFDAGDINGVDNDGNGKVDDLVGWDFTNGITLHCIAWLCNTWPCDR